MVQKPETTLAEFSPEFLSLVERCWCWLCRAQPSNYSDLLGAHGGDPDSVAKEALGLCRLQTWRLRRLHECCDENLRPGPYFWPRLREPLHYLNRQVRGPNPPKENAPHEERGDGPEIPINDYSPLDTDSSARERVSRADFCHSIYSAGADRGEHFHEWLGDAGFVAPDHVSKLQTAFDRIAGTLPECRRAFDELPNRNERDPKSVDSSAYASARNLSHIFKYEVHRSTLQVLKDLWAEFLVAHPTDECRAFMATFMKGTVDWDRKIHAGRRGCLGCWMLVRTFFDAFHSILQRTGEAPHE